MAADFLPNAARAVLRRKRNLANNRRLDFWTGCARGNIPTTVPWRFSTSCAVNSGRSISTLNSASSSCLCFSFSSRCFLSLSLYSIACFTAMEEGAGLFSKINCLALAIPASIMCGFREYNASCNSWIASRIKSISSFDSFFLIAIHASGVFSSAFLTHSQPLGRSGKASNATPSCFINHDGSSFLGTCGFTNVWSSRKGGSILEGRAGGLGARRAAGHLVRLCIATAESSKHP
mmetsp:Transcript_14156/g.31432  ORF Transcript_14156/g.31432 Transcript_14156/m.31432 type:complete len:234 (-) Transcript_14156:1557-2258(-)